jgi:HAD superfamily hydrolase (TIGR01509 family)
VNQFDLIIFDCDGVLVDSERLAVRTEALILAELGWPLSESEIIARFVGRSAADMCREVEAHIERTVDWDEEFEARYREVFEKELVAVTGIVDTLNVIDTLTCVASSGTHAGIQYRLEKTGLFTQFEGRIFSSDDVARGKPAPDLFLHAAQSMGVDQRNCAVVEDSVSGVVAGLEAEMTVFGFSGSVTSSEELASAGATTFGAMSELPNLLVGN